MITKFKIYENNSDNMIDVTDYVDTKIAKTLPDIRNEIDIDDKVFCTYYDGTFTTYLIEFEDLGDNFARDMAKSYYDPENDNEAFEDVVKQCSLGVNSEQTIYTIYDAYFVFSYDDYIKLDPNFELKMISKKYNL